MAVNIAVPTQGTTVQVNNDTTPVELNDVLSISIPGTPSPTIQVSHLQSTEVEKISGLRDNGQATLQLHTNDVDPGQVIVDGLATSGATDQMLITLANGHNYTIDYTVSQLGVLDGSINGVYTRNLVIEVSGVAFSAT